MNDRTGKGLILDERLRSSVLEVLLPALSNLLAVYVFGSRVQGDFAADSDLDLAVLVEGRCDTLILWNLANDLASILGCEVDLLDMRSASTVMQYQIITTGVRWWAKDSQAGVYESFVLSEKTELDQARAGLMADIQRSGRIHAG